MMAAPRSRVDQSLNRLVSAGVEVVRVSYYDEEFGAFTEANHQRSLRDVAGLLRILHRLVPRGAALLDVGAGSGRVTTEVLRAGYSATALDIETAALGRIIVPEGMGRLRTIVGDVLDQQCDLGGPYAACVVPSGTVNCFTEETDLKQLGLRLARALGRQGFVIAWAFEAAALDHFRTFQGELWPAAYEHPVHGPQVMWVSVAFDAPTTTLTHTCIADRSSSGEGVRVAVTVERVWSCDAVECAFGDVGLALLERHPEPVGAGSAAGWPGSYLVFTPRR